MLTANTKNTPFGTILDGRKFGISSRIGFNSKEKDPETVGTNGNTYDYGFRIYNPSLARFLSVDPLSKSYPWNTTFGFAENSPITGVDLDGLEYLKSDEARIEVINGSVKLKISNFLQINQNAFKTANSNPQNWNPGEVGLRTEIGKVNFSQASTPTATDTYITPSMVNVPFTMDVKKVKTVGPAGKTNDPTINPTQTTVQNPTTAQSNNTAVDKRFSTRTIASGASGGTAKGAAGAIALVNTVTFALEQYSIFAPYYDNGLVKDHTKMLDKAIADVNSALKQGDKIIPLKYQNAESFGNIVNVVLQGKVAANVPAQEAKEIMEIGMKIYNTISNPPSTTPQTATTYLTTPTQ